ncbi:hypothetical protein BH09ACT1_BH09ACT1_12010 [soil metagenome]
MSRIFVPGAFSWINKGDAALIMAFLPWLTQHLKVDQFILTSFTPAADSQYFSQPVIDMVVRPNHWTHRYADTIGRKIPGGRIVITRLRLHAFRIINRAVAVWAGIFLRNRRLARVLVSRNVFNVARAITESELVISVPGGYLNALRPTNDWWLFHVPTFALAKALGKPVVLGPCSLGPFDELHREQAIFALNLAQLILVRERWSYELALDLGVPEDRLVLTPDMAFAFDDAPASPVLDAVLDQLGTAAEGRELVGVSVRLHNFPGYTDPAEKQREYLRLVADALTSLQREANPFIVIVPQTLEDIGPGEDLARLLKGADVLNVQADLSPTDLKLLYSQLRLLVGTRMHANILAMSAGTPVAAIAYEPKTLGILESMGLRDHGLWIDQLGDGALTELVRSQWLAAPQLRDSVLARAQEQRQLLDRTGEMLISRAGR